MNRIPEIKNVMHNALLPNLKPVKLPEIGRHTITFNEAYFFLLTLELVDYQKSSFFQKLQGNHKQNLNHLVTHVKNMRCNLMNGWSSEEKDQFDSIAAAAWEVLDAFIKSTDKKQFLALCNCFNKGLVTMEGFDRPLNQVPFAEVVASRKEVAQ